MIRGLLPRLCKVVRIESYTLLCVKLFRTGRFHLHAAALRKEGFIVSSETKRVLNVIQLIVEIGIIIGYVVGLIPFGFLWSGGWVVPLVFVSAVIGLINSNRTLLPAVVNIVLAFLSYIPLVGYVTRIVGLLVSAYNISLIRRDQY